jgi:hypothetical protein
MKRLNRLFPLLCVSFILAQSNDGSQAKPTAAVLDFDVSGITTQEAEVLTQRLGSELVQTNALIMVERNQMSEIMDEQGLHQVRHQFLLHILQTYNRLAGIPAHPLSHSSGFALP